MNNNEPPIMKHKPYTMSSQRKLNKTIKLEEQKQQKNFLVDCRIKKEDTGSLCMDSTMHMRQGRQVCSDM